MESNKFNFFKIPLYRFIFSTVLGLLAFFFLLYIYAAKKELTIFLTISNFDGIPAAAWILFFFLCFFLGEIFALLGEVILNLFYDFNPLRTRADNRESFFELFFALLGATILKSMFDYDVPKDYLNPPSPENIQENQPEQDEFVEKLTPFALAHITYNKDYQKFSNEYLVDLVDFHFIFGRIIAGLALILFIFGSIILEKDVLFILVIDALIIFILYISISKPSFVKFIILISIVVLTYYCYIYFSTECYSGAILLLLSLLLFLTSANYRAYGNNIIKYSMKKTLSK